MVVKIVLSNWASYGCMWHVMLAYDPSCGPAGQGAEVETSYNPAGQGADVKTPQWCV